MNRLGIKMWKCHKGNALLATVIGGAIMSSLIGITMSFFQSAFTWQRNLSSLGSLDETKQMLKLVLANKSYCDAIFIKKNFNPNPLELSKQKLSLESLVSPNDSKQTLIKVGDTLGGSYSIKELSIENFILAGTGRYIATFKITAGQKSGIQNTRSFTIGLNAIQKNTYTAELSGCFRLNPTSLIGSRAVFRAPGASAVSVTVPDGTDFVMARATSNFVALDYWDSEDFSNYDLTIDLESKLSNGTLIHTGGHGAGKVVSAVWNDQPFGQPVSLMGDLQLSGWPDGTQNVNLAPYTPNLSISGRELTIGGLVQNYSQDSWMFQFYGQ